MGKIGKRAATALAAAVLVPSAPISTYPSAFGGARRSCKRRAGMRSRSVLPLAIVILITGGLDRSFAQALPGTPLAGAGFGGVDISDGLNVLPAPVTAGDVVLFENPSGGIDRSNWSDVVRFFNMPVTFGGSTTTTGFAFGVSDGEGGIGSIAVLNALNGALTLGDTLSGNSVSLQEVQTGVGTDADITGYAAAAGTSYNIHSDAAQSPDQPDVIIQPGGLLNPPPGMQNKPNIMLNFVEGANETAGPLFAPLDLAPGAIAVGPDFGDTLTFVAVAGGTMITLTSDPANDASPAEMEAWAVMGDESITSGYILSEDIPEPSTLLLCGFGAAWLGYKRLRGRAKQHGV